ncbi:heterokaryon incompatibility protein-domain-containing protein [Fusarium avenaceum]|nr:heterokaryon incompatibility protein-domain-containing protein [Fusarium avenaceum]
MPVTVNLAAALRTLRRLEFFNGRFMLWADSVCINQADLEERNSQVATMRDLYTSSWTTIAFLGTAADNSDKALALLKTLAIYEQNNTTNHLKNILQDNPAYLGGQGEWLALQAFLQRSYWSRLWIVQEVALAPSSMLMFAGDDYITWRQVQDALTSIHTCLWYVKDLCLKHDRAMLHTAQGRTDGEVSGVWDTANLHHVDKGLARLSRKVRKEAISYGELLEVACATTCAEPLDKIYGVLAFMRPVIRSQIVVDYRLQPSQLFSQVAQLFITHDKALELLYNGNSWNKTNTPSWAPDWTWEHHSRDTLSPTLPYQADGGIPAQVSFSPDGRILQVRGVIVDTVRGPVGDDIVRTPNEIDIYRSAYGSFHPTRSALYHTLIGGRLGFLGERKALENSEMQIFNLPKCTAVALKGFRKKGWAEFSIQGQRYEEWENWRQTNDGIDLGKLGYVGDFFSNTIPADGSEELLWTDFVRFRNVASGRKFVTTDGGRFGWAPASTTDEEHMGVQGGDLFCLVFGCKLPLVIRRVGQNYCVIGAGYLQGYMDGNILTELQTGQRAAEELLFI